MVKRAATLAGIVAALIADFGRAVELPAYQLGDVATNDVIALSRLAVVDDEATAELQKQEAGKIDLFVVYSTNHAFAIEQKVKLAVARMREEFLAVLQANYGARQLGSEVIGSQGFQELVDQFLVATPDPPVPRRILPVWAEGGVNEGYLEDWFIPLRQVMQDPVGPVRMADGGPVDESMRLRLVPVNDLRLFVKEESAMANSSVVQGSDLVSIAVTRSNFFKAFPETNRAVASYMVKQLEPNCRFDTNLTQRVKDFTVGGLVRMKHFEPGEVVIRKGQTIDKQALAALARLQEDAKVSSLERQVAVDRVSVQLLSERNLWLVGLLGGAGLLLVALLLWSHRRHQRSLVPVLSSSIIHEGAQEEDLDGVTVVDALPADEEHWRRRALAAEWQAEQAKMLAKSNLMPHVAQQLKDDVVQHLAAQVGDMLDVQAAVAEQMAALEERLERMHAPLQERLRTYEQRIAELEAELGQRGRENQELLRARIDALRRQMEREKAQAKTGVN